jgi:hypothetical protein
VVSALTGGSVLRAGLRIFAGLRDVPDPGPDTHVSWVLVGFTVLGAALLLG